MGARAKLFYIPGSGITAPPKLTAEEHAILQENDSCTKCCQIAPGHQGRCTNNVSSGNGYKLVAYLLLNGNAQSSSSGSIFTSTSSTSTSSTCPSGSHPKHTANYENTDCATKKSRTINTIYEDGSSCNSNLPVTYVEAADMSVSNTADNFFNFSGPGTSLTIPSYDKYRMTSHQLPSHHNTSQHNHHDATFTTQVTRQHVPNPTQFPSTGSVVSAINANQFLWNCKLMSPISEFPIAARALIDTVLIKEDLINSLALQRHLLVKPLPIHTATNTCKLLTHYVTLSLSSSDLSYAMQPVRAIILNTLSNDIILGMPFLERNNIVVDVAAATVSDKQQNYISTNRYWSNFTSSVQAKQNSHYA